MYPHFTKNDIEIIRIRTKISQEYIITQHGEFTMVAVQLCGKAIEEAKRAAAEAAKAELEAQNAKNKKEES